jgi:hypothetical protein
MMRDQSMRASHQQLQALEWLVDSFHGVSVVGAGQIDEWSWRVRQVGTLTDPSLEKMRQDMLVLIRDPTISEMGSTLVALCDLAQELSMLADHENDEGYFGPNRVLSKEWPWDPIEELCHRITSVEENKE